MGSTIRCCFEKPEVLLLPFPIKSNTTWFFVNAGIQNKTNIFPLNDTYRRLWLCGCMIHFQRPEKNSGKSSLMLHGSEWRRGKTERTDDGLSKKRICGTVRPPWSHFDECCCHHANTYSFLLFSNTDNAHTGPQEYFIPVENQSSHRKQRVVAVLLFQTLMRENIIWVLSPQLYTQVKYDYDVSN